MRCSVESVYRRFFTKHEDFFKEVFKRAVSPYPDLELTAIVNSRVLMVIEFITCEGRNSTFTVLLK